MARLTEPDQVLFAVEEHDVFASVRTPDGGRRHLLIRDKKAIVNVRDDRVVGVVSKAYRLVTNREAIDLAYECCRVVFPETTQGEWNIDTVDAPASGSHCFVDLQHNSAKLDFSVVPPNERPEVFGPFIRVINSYNGLRAPAFEIGFFRKVCRNGLILPKSVIRFTYNHSAKDLATTIKFDAARPRLKELEASFQGYMASLRNCATNRPQADTLVRSVLKLPRALRSEAPVHEQEAWEDLNIHLTLITDRYTGELGMNAYAVFNIVTEFASHPPTNRLVRRERHSLQKQAGAWVNDFAKQCAEPGFSVNAYLAKVDAEAA